MGRASAGGGQNIMNGHDAGGGKDLTGGIIIVAYFGKGPTAQDGAW
jgi:hypothetical protein